MGANKLIRNRIKCLNCGDIIESRHVHEFVWCSCGNVAVDGGLEYGKRCYKEHANYIDLSEWEAVEEISEN